MRIRARVGCTDTEVRSLIATARLAEVHNWYQHPCFAEQKRIAPFRWVDEDYYQEAAEALFTDLMDDEEHEILSRLELDYNTPVTA